MSNREPMKEALLAAEERLEAKHRSRHLNSEQLKERIAYLKRLEIRFAVANRLVKPYVFVSYTKEREKLGVSALRLIHQAPSLTPTTGDRFLAETGYREGEERGAAEVLNHVLSYLKRCCLFLGIMTKDFALAKKGGEKESFAPGVWVTLEAGMAQAMGIPVVLLVEDGLHEDYWLKPFQLWRHVRFTEKDFTKKVGVAVELLRHHYAALRRDRPA